MSETSRDRFERIKSEVLTLTKAQKAAVVKLLSTSATPTEREDGSVREQRIYSLVDLVVHEMTGSHCPPFAVMMKRMGQTMHRALTAVIVFVDQVKVEPRLTEAQKEATYLFLVRLVATNMQRDKELPMTFTTLVQQLEQVGLYVDDAYPGYLRSCQLLVILRAAKIV